MSQPKHVATVEDEIVSLVKDMLRVDAWHVPVVISSTEKIYSEVLGLENFIDFNQNKLGKSLVRKFLK